MSKVEGPPSAALRARIAAIANRELPLDEWRARIDAQISKDERDETRELIRWFKRRYPSAADRLAYVRRAHKRWMRAQLS